MATEGTNGLQILMEFTGTFILSSAINLSTVYEGETQTGNILLIILSFFTAVTLSRTISGGHINPAVTLAVYIESPTIKRNRNQQLWTLYILAQFLGALTACLFSFIFYRENIFKISISDSTLPFHAFLIEIMSTGFFIYTILCQGMNNIKNR